MGDLEYPEKRAFLDLARIMMSADGKITIEEREMLHDAVEEMDLDVREEKSLGAERLNACCNSVVSPRARVTILFELASFAFIDHDYDAREQELLRAVAETWQIDKISVVQIEEWAYKRVKLAHEAAEIIHEVETFRSLQNE